MTLEEHKAMMAAQKEARAKAKALAKQQAAAAPKPEAPPVEEEKPVPAKEPEPPAPTPAKEEPAPAPEVDDWEAEAEEAAPPVQEVKEEPAPAKEEEVAPPPAKPTPAPEPVAETPAPEPAPAEEEPEEVQEEVVERKEGDLKLPDPRSHLNVVFIGHVDAGKSTTCGSILYLCNCVDERTIEKYKKEAVDKNRESWFLAYIMDTSDEEKAKGKTVEVGRASFETENRRFTVLDAPGHKSYVPNMISGASQADIAVLIISARKGEFETGFERGGQTREHAQLAKTLGVEKLIIAVNKMDDPSVGWKQERYDEIVTKLSPFLKQASFKQDQLFFLPMSGLTGDNVKERQKTPAWYSGPSLLGLMDSLPPPDRNANLPLRIPMLDGYRDMGAIMSIGKVEQGTVRPGTKAIVMPIAQKCTIVSVYINDEEVQYAQCGENVTMKMNGITEDVLNKGYVLCVASSPLRAVAKFKAQLQVLELPEERPVLTSGYRAVIHVHTASEECEILKLYEAIIGMGKKDRKTEKNPRFVREGAVLTCSIQLMRSISVEAFASLSQLGRFTLRDEGRTIAIGRITQLPNEGEEKKK